MQDANAIKVEERQGKLQKMNKHSTTFQTNVLSNGMFGLNLNNEEFISTTRKLLRCTVCLEDSEDVNQCKNGHLICQHCTHNLKLRLEPDDTQGKCPTCRIPLFPGISRCLLAVQLFSELPRMCTHCKLTIRQGDHEDHQNNLCPKRPVNCKYQIFGCQWKGRAADSKRHHILCEVSKKTVKDVESIIRETFNEHEKLAYYYFESWGETLNILNGHPLGAFIAIREASLSQVTEESRGKVLRFRGTTPELALSGRGDTTLELTIRLDDLTLSYRTKFPPQGMYEMRLRLITIDCKEVFIPVIDKFRLPNVKNSHTWQEFQGQLNVPPDKQTEFINVFLKLACEGGSGFMVRCQFLVVFEMSYLVQTIEIGGQEHNANTTTTLLNPQQTVINANTNHVSNPESTPQTMPVNETPSHQENTRESGAIGRSEADNRISTSSNETTDEEYESLSEDPPALAMQNNNALEEENMEDHTTQSLPNSDKSEPHSRNSESRACVPLNRRRGLRAAKSHNSYINGVASLVETITPYITRGHMWRNYEILRGNASVPFRLRRSARNKFKSKSSDNLQKLSLMKFIVEKWNDFRKNMLGIGGWGKSMILSPCDKIKNETKTEKNE
ncbi:unnamed protein product [Rodentolepis nana]|uniref:RING-type domain-containing protein n=1 Tax=Rodentolepis nana TaxID=102285 RepID=A0A0R3TMH4_RODNA|nr:unnamed protein product [Rodentolepis nana]